MLSLVQMKKKNNYVLLVIFIDAPKIFKADKKPVTHPVKKHKHNKIIILISLCE